MVLGLDLSLTASAVVAVPLDWDGDFRRVQTLVVGERLHRDSTDAVRAMRTDMIASRVLAFAQSVGATSAWVEGYAYSQNVAAHSLAELGGVVRLALVRAGIELHTVTASSARKLLLGKLPRGKQKEAVQGALKAAGAPASWSPDEFDAFAVPTGD